MRVVSLLIIFGIGGFLSLGVELAAAEAPAASEPQHGLTDESYDVLMERARGLLAHSLTELDEAIARLYFDPAPLGPSQTLTAPTVTQQARGLAAETPTPSSETPASHPPRPAEPEPTAAVATQGSPEHPEPPPDTGPPRSVAATPGGLSDGGPAATGSIPPSPLPPGPAARAADTAVFARADELLRRGNVAAARLWLSEVADRNAEAMFRLAETYDPRMLRLRGVIGLAGDADKAQELYARAERAGYGPARDRLDPLGH